MDARPRPASTDPGFRSLISREDRIPAGPNGRQGPRPARLRFPPRRGTGVEPGVAVRPGLMPSDTRILSTHVRIRQAKLSHVRGRS